MGDAEESSGSLNFIGEIRAAALDRVRGAFARANGNRRANASALAAIQWPFVEAMALLFRNVRLMELDHMAP